MIRTSSRKGETLLDLTARVAERGRLMPPESIPGEGERAVFGVYHGRIGRNQRFPGDCSHRRDQRIRSFARGRIMSFPGVEGVTVPFDLETWEIGDNRGRPISRSTWSRHLVPTADRPYPGNNFFLLP
jgi:hypothetical protein